MIHRRPLHLLYAPNTHHWLAIIRTTAAKHSKVEKVVTVLNVTTLSSCELKLLTTNPSRMKRENMQILTEEQSRAIRKPKVFLETQQSVTCILSRRREPRTQITQMKVKQVLGEVLNLSVATLHNHRLWPHLMCTTKIPLQINLTLLQEYGRRPVARHLSRLDKYLTSCRFASVSLTCYSTSDADAVYWTLRLLDLGMHYL
jgi:hypothetical protein